MLRERAAFNATKSLLERHLCIFLILNKVGSVSAAMAEKKQTVLSDMGRFIDKGVRVKLSGGREGALPIRC